jgi:hypothetical protein
MNPHSGSFAALANYAAAPGSRATAKQGKPSIYNSLLLFRRLTIGGLGMPGFGRNSGSTNSVEAF